LREIIPNIALSKNPPGATLHQLGNPETKTNISHLEDEVSNREEYILSVKETLHDIIPYADKKNIIWGIMFLEDTIHKVEKAAKSNID
jgi:hypothetical protein